MRRLLLCLLLLVGIGADCPMTGDMPAGMPVSNENTNTSAGAGQSDWPQAARLTAFDPAGDDLYGDKVAGTENTVAVGTEHKDQLKGVVDVFVKFAGAWQYFTRLTRGPARMPEQGFGSSVAVSNNQVFVGAHKFAIEGSFHIQRGAVYVYSSRGADYEQVQLLTISDGMDFEHFGNSMAYEQNQGHLIVGAMGRNRFQGAAYVFKTQGGTFAQTARLTASDATDSDNFGASVAMSNVWAAVGAPIKQSGLGAVYVFERSGDDWDEIQKISATDGVKTDQFGSAVDMDDDLLVVSAPSKKRPGDELLMAGAVYVYRRIGGSYTLETTIVPDDEFAGLFGSSIAVHDGRIAIGVESKGAALIYEKKDDAWGVVATIIPDESHAVDSFGNAMALVDDGLIVGARSSNEAGERAAGAVYVFTEPGSNSGPNIPGDVRFRDHVDDEFND